MIRYFVILCVAFARVLPAQDTARVSLLFLGDIMQHDSQIEAAYNPATALYDYSDCFELLRPYFQSADLTIGNLELTLAGKPYKGYPQFSAPDELAATLKNVGVDVLVTANNHSVDRRKKGLERTIRVLDSLGILHTGTFREEVERLNDYPLLISKNGIRIALLNYTYGTNGIPVTSPNLVNLMDTAVIRLDLERARELQSDAVVVFMHWGDEYQSQPNKRQRELAEFCFRHGAMLVIGAHPHVLQPMEWNRSRNQLVAYSLGNFVSGQRTRYRDGGAMLKVELHKVFTDSTASTSIDTANFVLQWVYRTTGTKSHYKILPVPTVEPAFTEHIRGETARIAFKTFLDDSRKLLNTFNKGIVEHYERPADTLVRFSVLLSQTPGSEDWSTYPPEQALAYGFEVMNVNGNSLMLSGSFRRREDAERYLQKILVSWPQGRVVRFVNDELVE